MSAKGIAQFCHYILYVYYRWARVTYTRYGLWALLDSTYRPRRRGTGVGVRFNPHGRAHDISSGVWSPVLLASLQPAGVGRHRA